MSSQNGSSPKGVSHLTMKYKTVNPNPIKKNHFLLTLLFSIYFILLQKLVSWSPTACSKVLSERNPVRAEGSAVVGNSSRRHSHLTRHSRLSVGPLGGTRNPAGITSRKVGIKVKGTDGDTPWRPPTKLIPVIINLKDPAIKFALILYCLQYHLPCDF